MGTVSIRYRLSEAGQKASLLAGGDGAEIQEAVVSREMVSDAGRVPNPDYIEVVEMGDVDSEGDVVLDVAGSGFIGAALPPGCNENQIALHEAQVKGRQEELLSRCWDDEPTVRELIDTEKGRRAKKASGK